MSMVIPKTGPWKMWGLLSGELRRRKVQSNLCLMQTVSVGSLHLDRTNYLAYLLKPPKSSLTDWPPMASDKWPTAYVCLSVQTAPLRYPSHYTESQMWRKTVMATANVWTVSQTAVVHTVTVIVMVMQQICTDYWKSVESLGGCVGCYKMFSLENYTSFDLLAHLGPKKLHFMIFWKWPTAAILDLKARAVSKH